MSIMGKVRGLPGWNTVVLPWHFVKAMIAGVRFGFPAKKKRGDLGRLKVIGVTGTNGKTTTCFMIWKMLNTSGHKAGLMTTVAWGVDKLENQVEHMTTVDSMTLNRRISEIARSGAEYLVLEVTSHAMVQFRTLGVPIDIAVMTNVTHEHLDYHKTFERYRDAKRKLFKKAAYGIVNADDPSAAEFAKDCDDVVTYGIEGGALRASEVKLAASGVSYEIDGAKFKTRIPGEFNVYNSLATVAVGRKLGLSDKEIAEGIYALEAVEGRMNRIDLGQNFEVIVDFAHTPDAFEKVFKSVTPRSSGRVISLFGGAGRRDESTRAERGEIAGKFSDIVIVTEDDSRDEDPAKIAEMFVDGCLKAGMAKERVLVELDRRRAIYKAIASAKKGDLVLILGKGHEKTILRANGPEPFEDLKVTTAAVKARLKRG